MHRRSPFPDAREAKEGVKNTTRGCGLRTARLEPFLSVFFPIPTYNYNIANSLAALCLFVLFVQPKIILHSPRARAYLRSHRVAVVDVRQKAVVESNDAQLPQTAGRRIRPRAALATGLQKQVSKQRAGAGGLCMRLRQASSCRLSHVLRTHVLRTGTVVTNAPS